MSVSTYCLRSRRLFSPPLAERQKENKDRSIREIAIASIPASPSLSDSIRAVLGDIRELHVFGFAHCLYSQICEALLSETPRKIEAFTNKLLEADVISLMHLSPPYQRKTLCKSALIYVVFHNFQRYLAGRPPIPLIFSIAREDEVSLRRIDWLTKDPTKKLYTASEIKRAFKLCFEEALPPIIREIARQTFRFVKVKAIDTTPLSITLIEPPWDDSWKVCLKTATALETGWRSRLVLATKEEFSKRHYLETAALIKTWPK